MSLGAGVDGLLKPGVAAPGGPPLLRVVDPLMAQRMATWVRFCSCFCFCFVLFVVRACV
jgi:hypothetical protein